MKIDNNVKLNRLLDRYEKLLTKTQLEIMALYFREDWSLQEIAKKHKVTRTSVHTTLKRAEAILLEYEANLGLVTKDDEILKILNNKKLSKEEIVKEINKIVNK
jgi:predicted DNA-binding protein YlxM (UPF0122 family)